MANHAQTVKARATFVTLMFREDHQKLRQLFEQFDNTTMTKKREIVKETLALLEVHTTLKQELIYPAWREYVHEQSLDLMDEARETLHAAHGLIKALKNMGPEDERFETMYAALRKQVMHHINEEEGKLFPLAERTDLDWERLTTHVIQRRQSLEQKPLWLLGVPVSVNARETVGTRAVLPGRSGG
jgi:hemerythrin-like domain-containing protein